MVLGNGSVIVGGARTPIGRLLGGLSTLSAVDLGGLAIRAALQRSGLSGDDVDYVLMGQVLQAGAGQMPARQAAVAGGVPMSVPSMTINKVCLSGIDAIALADQLIRAGEVDIVVAGGMESMSNAPHLLPKSREGYKYGSVELVDSMAYDGLTDAVRQHRDGCRRPRDVFDPAQMGISRAEQDEFSARSHQRAAQSARAKDGIFDDEIVPVSSARNAAVNPWCVSQPGRRHSGRHLRRRSLAKLKTGIRRHEGTITAGSASQISDGACAVVVTSAATAARRGLPVLAEIGAHGIVAGPDNSLLSQPSRAINRALEREGLTVRDLALIEINEAFASVALHSMRDLGLDDGLVNVNGGAIALGHPIGMSGARLVLHLALELGRRGGGIGVAGLCGGGGQGDALILRVPA